MKTLTPLAALFLTACPKEAPLEPVPVPASGPVQSVHGGPPSAESIDERGRPPVALTKAAPSMAWEQRVGLTSYRSTILVHGGRVILGSNGEGWHSEQDSLDGVWLLDAGSGRVLSHLVPPGTGEKDVNGVALDGDSLIFGTDQGLVYKARPDGQVLWIADIGGDAEAAPGLYEANGDGILDVAIAAEGASFLVLDGRSGQPLHRIASSMGDYGQRGFVAPPALYDVTGDGVLDIFAPGRDNWMHAVDGASGQPLWSNQHTSGLHGAPALADSDGDGLPELIYTESYSDLHAVDPVTGQWRWGASLEHPSLGIEGLFGPVTWHPGLGCALVGTAWWREQEGLYCVGPEGVYWRYTEPTGNITSGAVLGDVDGRHGFEIVFGTESGKLVALSGRGEPVWVLELGAPIECTPTLADIDGDGLLEIIVASNDGFVRAYDTAGKAPALLGYHRGDRANTGLQVQD
jgi:outer membrane protein assembly factor BamB